MIISTLEELRLHLPANAIDNIESMTGFIESSEYDTLRDKLGKTLYAKLTAYYSALSQTGIEEWIEKIQTNETLEPYERLLFIAQRIVAFDAICNAVGAHVVSINGAGINTMSADDYAPADKDKIAEFKQTCRVECHKAINMLLETLEDWVKDLAGTNSVSDDDTATVSDDSSSDDKTEICTAWEDSRYYFLSAGLIIPTLVVLMNYWDIYDNREKFIQMLPDIRYIHEEILAQTVGEDFLEYMTKVAIEGTTDKIQSRIIDRLRKACAAHLESRTKIVNTDKDRRMAAHNEAISLTDLAVEYISNNQESFEGDMLEAFKTSPLYHPTSTDTTAEPEGRKFINNRRGNAFFATPGLR